MTKQHAISFLVVILLVSFPGARSRATLDQGGESLPTDMSMMSPTAGVWYRLPNGPSLSDAGGWDQPQYYSTIQTADIDRDFRDELLVRSAVRIAVWGFDPTSNTWSQLPDGPGWSDAEGWDQPQYYSTIQTGDIDGDLQDELLARSAAGIEAWGFDPTSNTWSQLPNGPGWSDAGGWDQPQYYSTIQTGYIDGDFREELLARSAAGIEAWGFDQTSNTWSQLPNGPSWSDAGGWDQPQYYSTIQIGDIHLGPDELLARSAAGIEVWRFNPTSNTWSQLPNGPSWSDAGGWDQPQYYSTIQTGDIDGNFQDELLVRNAADIQAWGYDSTSNTWSQLPNGPGWSDAGGWDRPQYYSTIQMGDIDGDSQKELLARNAAGIEAWGFDYEISGLSANNDGPTALGQPTMFTATVTSGSDVSYAWDFGDGNIGSGSMSYHTFTSTGTYTATVTASNPVSSDTATTTVTVEAYLFLPAVLK